MLNLHKTQVSFNGYIMEGFYIYSIERIQMLLRRWCSVKTKNPTSYGSDDDDDDNNGGKNIVAVDAAAIFCQRICTHNRIFF